MSALSRRQFMAAMMAGGVMTAAGLWMPGTKLISIPKRIVVPPGYVRIILDDNNHNDNNHNGYPVRDITDPLPVGVNGRIMLIPRGVPVNVPQVYVSVLDNCNDPNFRRGTGRPWLPYPYRRLAA